MSDLLRWLFGGTSWAEEQLIYWAFMLVALPIAAVAGILEWHRKRKRNRR